MLSCAVSSWLSALAVLLLLRKQHREQAMYKK
jgi:hypothetical protein